MAEELLNEIGGTWKHERSENFKSFLDQIDMGTIKKKIAQTANPTMKIKATGEKITVKVSLGPKTMKETFQIGVEFKPESDDTIKTAKAEWDVAEKVMTVRLTHKDPKKSYTVTRKVVNEELVQTMTAGDVVCTRIFKKVL